MAQTLDEQADEALAGTELDASEFGQTGDTGRSARRQVNTGSPLPWFFPILLFLPWMIGGTFFVIFGIIFLTPIVRRRMQKQYGHMKAVDESLDANLSEYSDEIPYKGNLSDVAYLLHQLHVGSFDDYSFAFLLKWAKEGIIDMVTQEVGTVRKREEMVIQLTGEVHPEASDIEKDLWEMLEDAANENQQIRENDLSKWAQRQHSRLATIEKHLTEDSKEFLVKEGYMTTRTERRFLFFKAEIDQLTPAGREVFDRIVQYEHFLMDVNDKKATKEEVEAIED